MKRELAAKIAKDLVEGGIDDPLTIKVTAQGRGVSQAVVKRIRERMTENYPKRNAMYPGQEWVSIRNDHLCSMVDAIENGWEDERLGLDK